MNFNQHPKRILVDLSFKDRPIRELEYRTIAVLCLPEIVNNIQIEVFITHSGAITASATDIERFIATPERRMHCVRDLFRQGQEREALEHNSTDSRRARDIGLIINTRTKEK